VRDNKFAALGTLDLKRKLQIEAQEERKKAEADRILREEQCKVNAFNNTL
jgi:hypothetical protein